MSQQNISGLCRQFHLKKIHLLVGLFLFCVLTQTACQVGIKGEFKKGIAKSESRNFSEALAHFKNVYQFDPQGPLGILAAKESLKIANYEIKDYKLTAELLKILIVNDSDPAERVFHQKQLVSAVFDQLADYRNAIKEIEIILGQNLNETERIEYKIKLARSFYYLNDFDQALIEVNELLKKSLLPEKKYQLLLLKGNCYLAKKDVTRTSEIFLQIVNQFPELSEKDNVVTTLAFSYEEMGDFKKAIEVLEKSKANSLHPDFLDIRIKKLKSRLSNQPGARGFRK